MDSKKCRICGVEKAEDLFYKKSGKTCKACCIEKSAACYAKDKAKVIERNRLWYNRPEVAARLYEQKRKNGFSTSAVSSALRYGTIVKQPCQFCQSETKVEAHHEDYSKLLDVMWLCQWHHQQLHRLKRSAKIG